MRLVVLTALIVTAGCASQATAPDQAASAGNREATQAAAASSSAEGGFNIPPGYRKRPDKGPDVYCAKMVVLGSRFPKEDCRTEQQLRDLEEQKAAMRGEMGQRMGVCASANPCSSN
ncbi:MAG TPA: hypothetical protein VF161_05315 [Steroidobacteraceae bacterium]